MVAGGTHDRDGLGVHGGAVVGDLSDVSGVVVGVVVDVLDHAVGEGNRVRALTGACAIVRLSGVEVGVGVVVGNGVVVGEGGDLIGVNLSGVVGRGGVGNSVDHRGVVGRGSMHNRGGVVGRGSVVDSVDNGGRMVGRGGVVSRRSMVDSVDNGSRMVGRGGVVGRSNNSVSNTSVVSTVSEDSSLVKMGIHSGLGNVGHRVVGRVGGDGGAKSLGLGVAPDLTLVGFGDRHLGGLATAVASSVAGQELARGSGHKGGEANKSLE